MNRLARYIIIAASIALICFLAWYFSNILIYILISAVFSLIGRPIVKRLDRIRILKKQFPRVLSATITLLMFWALILLFIFVLSPLITGLVGELSSIKPDELITNIAYLLHNIETWIIKTIPGVDPDFSLQKTLITGLSNFINESALLNIFGSVTNMLISIGAGMFVVSFITFFFLKEDHLFSNGVMALFPQKYEENARHAFQSVSTLLGRYFIGIFIDIFCVMTIITLGLTFIGGLPFTTALVLGFIAGILNLIPYIGPLVSLLLGCGIGLIVTHSFGADANILLQMLKMALVYIGTNIIDASFFQPYIYSNSIKAHPLEIFLVIITAGSVGGIIGMIIAIPAYTVVRVFAKEFFNHFRVVRKLTEKI
ncbi:MAG: AI-2E family transporter [Prevotellaceae bacterium]|jgi:predicted PurR-regulated permease PerM|nr:AI-2E family transporter [Prevotellaceae bacterium]